VNVVRVEPVNGLSNQSVEASRALSYPNNDKTNDSTGRFQTANALNGTSGQFGITDVAQFVKSSDALKATKDNPVTSSGLPFVQRLDLSQPAGDLGLQQQVLRDLQK
jgi:hypothetical protein